MWLADLTTVRAEWSTMSTMPPGPSPHARRGPCSIGSRHDVGAAVDRLQIKRCPRFTLLQVLCREQEDNSYTTGTGEEMVNQSWAYCSPFYQETELPACECDESWTVEASTCSGGSGRETTFTGCPTTAKMSECEGSAAYAGAEQTWCQTTFARYGERRLRHGPPPPPPPPRIP